MAGIAATLTSIWPSARYSNAGCLKGMLKHCTAGRATCSGADCIGRVCWCCVQSWLKKTSVLLAYAFPDVLQAPDGVRNCFQQRSRWTKVGFCNLQNAMRSLPGYLDRFDSCPSHRCQVREVSEPTKTVADAELLHFHYRATSRSS